METHYISTGWEKGEGADTERVTCKANELEKKNSQMLTGISPDGEIRDDSFDSQHFHVVSTFNNGIRKRNKNSKRQLQK